MGIITLEIGTPPVEKYFINLHYTKNHPSPDPDTFDLILTPEEASGIDYFDLVVTKKDGVAEFVGFVEEITPEIGEGGLEYSITGRCYKLILWKKFTERYQESRDIGPEDTDTEILETGFFGQVYPKELIKFILHCPISDNPQGTIRHKIGWGIASDFWNCCADPTAEGYDPQWVKLRYSELCWRSRGDMVGVTVTNLIVDGFDHAYEEWNVWGAEPWLDTCDTNLMCSSIYTDYLTGDKKEGNFSFEDLDPTATYIHNVFLKITQHCYFYAIPEYIEIYLYDGSFWVSLGYFQTSSSWETKTIDVSDKLKTPAQVNAAKIYFEIHQPDPTPKAGGVEITCAYLEVQWGIDDISDIYQTAGDYFIVNLGKLYDDVTGILVECRRNENAYARNYDIKYCSLSSCCDPSPESDWHDFDDLGSPIDVTNNTARDLLHSWAPQDDVQCIRIMITASSDATWEISQIYIWQADTEKYRVMDE